MLFKSLHKTLYLQVLVAIAIGIALGYFYPQIGIKMQPLADGFIKLIKMIIGPIIFCTIVSGIAGMRDMKKVGRVGIKTLLYFEAVSTLALLLGLGAAHLFKPGASFHVDIHTLDVTAVAQYATQAKQEGVTEFLLHLIPSSIADAFATGNILQILLIAILFGTALSVLGERGKPLTQVITVLSQVFFYIVSLITRLAPIAAFGAMAFTIGKYGLHAFLPLLKLIGTFYFTAFVFVIFILGSITQLIGFNIFRFLAYLKEELLIVLGTSSSEAALPQLMQKMENLGCSESVVGLVVPTGYSFNLDGTNIYMTLSILFIAQATQIELSWMQELTLLVVAMISSKGASGVVGAGFVTLAATLAVIPTIPLAGILLILGIDRFMAECRSLTNFIGNGVATVVISAWEKELDRDKLRINIQKEEMLCL